MDTQIIQIAQRISHLSWPQGHLPGQPKTNPMGHINAISVVGEGIEESPVMVLQGTVLILDSTGTNEQKEEESLISNKMVTPAPPIHPYQPYIPYP